MLSGMDCVSYCTASSYDLKSLLTLVDGEQAHMYRDALHVSIQVGSEQGSIFYFEFGVTVCWGLQEKQQQRFLSYAQQVQRDGLDHPIRDDFIFSFGEEATIVKDEIVVPSRDPLSLLALSHGIAQSVKLEAFEASVQNVYNLTKHIPLALSKRGSIALSRREIRRMMGQLFIERSSINLQWDVLDTPEFFWENVELKPLYTMVSNYLDIENRVQVLNQRLDIVHDLFEMLGNELNHQHSSRLEWTIIWLIIIEVVLTLLKDFFHLL